MTKDQYGVFEITLPAQNDQPAIPHDSKVKVRRGPTWLSALSTVLIIPAWLQISMVLPSGERIERLPAWIK